MEPRWHELMRPPTLDASAWTGLRFLALAAGVASAAQSVFPTSGDPVSALKAGDRQGIMIRMCCEADAWVISAAANTLADPIVGQSWPLFAKGPQDFFVPLTLRYFKVLSPAGGWFVWYRG